MYGFLRNMDYTIINRQGILKLLYRFEKKQNLNLFI